MYKLNCNLKVKIRSILPNYITLLCGMILITTISGKIYLEYLIPLFALFYFFVVKRGMIQGPVSKDIFVMFVSFIVLQCIGLLKNVTFYSVKNIITSSCVLFLVAAILRGSNRAQAFYIKIYYVIACISIPFLSRMQMTSKNTITGCMVFLFLLLTLILHERYLRNHQNKRGLGIMTAIRFSICMMPAVIFSFLCASRTALFVSILLVVLFCLFYFFDFKPSTYKKLFTVMLIFIVLGLTLYINAKDYKWYESLNVISQQYFGKNIDSSRSYLWQTSLAQLKGTDWIWGLGTGIKPFIPRYANSSFHNSFIQTLMQNGVIGLSCVVFIFWIIWTNIVKIEVRPLRALFMSAFVAVVLYNCMECCLLQNKSFLGMIQWSILSLGVYYAPKGTFIFEKSANIVKE